MSISINKNKNEGNFIEAEKSASNTRDKKRTRKKRDGVDGLESWTKEKDKVAEERDGNSGDPKKREKKQEREDIVTEAEKGANNTNDKKRNRKKSYEANGLESSLKGNDEVAEEKEGLTGDHKKRKKKQEREDNSPEAEKGANNTNDKRRKRKKSDEANSLESSLKGNDKVAEEKEGLIGDHKKRKKKQEREDNFTEVENGANNTNDKRRKRKKSDETNSLESSLKGNEKVAEEKEGLTGDRKKRKKKQEREDNFTEVEKVANNTNDKKRKRKKSYEASGLKSSLKGNDKVAEEKEGLFGDPNTSRPKKKARRVSFSGNVEVIPPIEDIDLEKYVEQGLIQGKRFSLEEDEMLKKAVFKYIEENQLGDDGLHMVLNCGKHPQVRTCWKQIRSSLPWRPVGAVYGRAHTLFERSEKRGWKPEEYIILRSLYEKHGARWKTMAKVLGKHRSHVKDAWRRIASPNLRKGHWSQDEYQTLFDLVNLDLKMKAFEEKETKHGMLRDNIAWGAVSMKLSTRLMSQCCTKWYAQLCSPMVSQGLWMNSDDNRMLDALFKLDACCAEDVDWDNLLEHRLGETCRMRWKEMTRHLGEYREKPFVEQLDMLLKRYQPEMLEYRELYEK